MDLRIVAEPSPGASYDQLLRLARTAEATGYDAFFRSDHYLTPYSVAGPPGPTDAWTTVAGLARDTSRIRLGVMGSAVTFRLPGPLAIAVAQVDVMSGGRVEVALSTGWCEAEHEAYAIPYPDLGERFARYEEQLQILVGLWTVPEGRRFTFRGRYYRLTESPGSTRPAQRPAPPIIVSGGGAGGERKPSLAARYADEFNLPYASPAAVAGEFARVRTACAEQGRDSTGMRWSTSLTLCCGRDEREVRRRASAIGRDADSVRGGGVAGTPVECVETLGRYADVGVERVYLQVFDVDDVDQLELVAAEVAPQLRPVRVNRTGKVPL